MSKVLLMTSSSSPGFHLAPPLGLLRLRQNLIRNGSECDVLDSDFSDESPFLAAVKTGAYDIVGMSLSHYNMGADLDKLWRFREAAGDGDVVFLGGGQEATLNADQWLRSGVDVIIAGFAEESLVAFTRRWRMQQGGPAAVRLAGLEGAAFLSDGNIVSRPAPALTAEHFREFNYLRMLDMSLPYAEYWDKVRAQSSEVGFNHGRFVVENVRLYTSSHCPRRCGFCSSQSFLPASQGHRLPVFMISADEVLGLLLDHVRKYGARSVLFSDDDFPVGSRQGLARLMRLCELVQGAKVDGRLPKDLLLNCQARVADFFRPRTRQVDTDLVRHLAAAGFHSVGLGVETFSDRLMGCPSIGKLGIRVLDCEAVLDALLTHGICPQINIILGIPESTAHEMMETIERAFAFIRKGCQVAVTSYIHAVPGSPVYGSQDYDLVYREWQHPGRNLRVLIADYLVPRDVAVRQTMEALEIGHQTVLERLCSRSAWPPEAAPKTLLGLAKFIAVARQLDAPKLAGEMEAYALRLLSAPERGMT